MLLPEIGQTAKEKERSVCCLMSEYPAEEAGQEHVAPLMLYLQTSPLPSLTEPIEEHVIAV